MKNIVIAFFLISFVAVGCTIKPPTDGSDPGPETTEQAVAKALATAQSGYAYTDAFHVNDTGTVQTTDSVLGNNSVESSYTYNVTSIDTQGVHFTRSDGHTTQTGLLAPTDWAATQTSFFNPVIKLQNKLPKIITLLPRPFGAYAASAYFHILRIFPSIQIENTQAIGQSKDISIQSNIGSNILGSLFDTTNASPTPTPSGTQTSRYFGLTVISHNLPLTSTGTACSQIPSCQVTSTRIEFTQITTTTTNGTSEDQRSHLSFEISIQVPGLFVFMNQCVSQLIVQGSQQVPLTQCITVQDFNFGGASK